MTTSELEKRLELRGITRREFVKFCTIVAGTLALPSGFGTAIARAMENQKRTPVVWLEFQDCAGCTESFLRASRPTAAEVVLDVLSVDYHETIMAAAGHRAEEAKAQTLEAGGYLLIVEGSIPTGEDGIYCVIGGRTAVDVLEEAAQGAIAVIAVGNCAAFGGIPKASPNPTGAKAVGELVTDRPVLNLPGCPLNVVNLTATVVHFLTFGTLPEMDSLGRPLFAHGVRIHDNCERRGHFDKGEFVREWGDEGHRQGWCLYQMGCKGPLAFHNCPTVRWNDGTSWPVAAGHGCIACASPGFWDLPGGVYGTAEMFDETVAPPAAFPPVEQPAEEISPIAAGVMGGVAGLAVGAAAAATARQLLKSDGNDSEEPGDDDVAES
jgi:hydrogenase small subunit